VEESGPPRKGHDLNGCGMVDDAGFEDLVGSHTTVRVVRDEVHLHARAQPSKQTVLQQITSKKTLQVRHETRPIPRSQPRSRPRPRPRSEPRPDLDPSLNPDQGPDSDLDLDTDVDGCGWM
jgi:hypothetical protein